MNCEHVKELLSAYLDDVLASDERQQIATHLHSCETCLAILNDFQHFDTLLAQLPRISPHQALHDAIFLSGDYLELTGTLPAVRTADRATVPAPGVRLSRSQRPKLVALPGGRHPSTSHSTSSSVLAKTLEHPIQKPRRRAKRLQRVVYGIIAATALLTLGMGSFIGWKIWEGRNQPDTALTGAITPPAGLQTHEPLPAGTRMVFQRDGALWSAPADGSAPAARLTPSQQTVATNWSIRPASPGHTAGNMLAYIDLQKAQVHTIRSDGQSDTVIAQQLVKAGISPSTIWDTETGHALLNSLAWSADGTMLAFVADPDGNGQTGLYLYNISTQTLQRITQPLQGAVSQPAWSPDSQRIACLITHNGTTGITDYNVQNQGLLTITSTVNTPDHPNDTVQTLTWSPNKNVPQLTWSVGIPGHIHSIWTQYVGINGTASPQRLIRGEFTQATYRAKDAQDGSWLLTTSSATTADLLTVDLNDSIQQMTSNKQVSFAQWSPDGTYLAYLEGSSTATGTLHIVNIRTANDTVVGTGVAITPAPAWSGDNSKIAFSTGTHLFVVNLQNVQTAHPLPLQGTATALNWSITPPEQLVVSLTDVAQGVYLIDLEHNTTLQLDRGNAQSPIQWSSIP